MRINRLNWRQTSRIFRTKPASARFFSQSLSQQTRLALLVASLPIVILSLWYTQNLTIHQHYTLEIYNNNQSVILKFNQLKTDVLALEKAQLNNELLEDAALQKSIEQKWVETKNNIFILKKTSQSPLVVAKWQQLLDLTTKTSVKNLDYATVNALLIELEPALQTQLANNLKQRSDKLTNLNQHFLIGLLAMLPLLALVSLLMIRRVSLQLSSLEHAIKQLGGGYFDTPIKLGGSEELSALGNKLDWLREQLQKSDKQKDTFLRHVSHELKTPLASLTEGNSLLKSDDFGSLSPAQNRIVNIMEKALGRLGNLIDDLLKYSAASHPLEQQYQNLEHIKTQIEQHFSDHKTRQEIHVDWQNTIGQHALPYLPVKLILTQLIGNALQYAASQVRVTLTKNLQSIQIDVIDDGPGIDATEQYKLMEPFYRGSHSHSHSGSGLGLAIVAQCVKQLSGTIEWQFESQGAHICIQFPCDGAKSYA